MFFYSENGSGGKSKVDVWKMNGTDAFMRHYDNYLFLSFVISNPRSTRAEKAQATTEIGICERKLTFWRRHPKFDQVEATRRCGELKRNWRSAA